MPENAKQIVVFGAQYTMKYIDEIYRKNFFNKPKEQVIGEAKKYLSSYLGCDYDVTHFEKLHDLGYLPIRVKTLKEGTVVGEKIPILTIYNTHPEFFWLPNFLETLISSLIWKPVHSASLAFGYKKILTDWAKKTDKNNLGFVNFQGHDFSFRGMQHPESAISSGLGFLTSFYGTDTIPALQASQYYYNSENVGFSVPASEHAVCTSYGKENELESFKRILTQYPTGIVSLVSDSYDLWKVCTEFVTTLKDLILSRDGKLVIRPDSGDPVDIICGTIKENTDSYENNREDALLHNQRHGKSDLEPEQKGVIELLWDVFGGTVNDQGYKVLDPHIGVIYGDSITLERANEICRRLEAKGFASTNIVLGVGSYSMGYATRDNQGGAVKATYVELTTNIGKSIGEVGTMDVPEVIGRVIFKDPITDDGTKKSARGLLYVGKNENGEYYLQDNVSWEKEGTGELETIFDGVLVKETSLSEIREILSQYL